MFRAVRYLSTKRMTSAPVKPLVAIVGATGTGKSDVGADNANIPEITDHCR